MSDAPTPDEVDLAASHDGTGTPTADASTAEPMGTAATGGADETTGTAGTGGEHERPVGPGGDRHLALKLAAPFAVALVVASWLLWTRQEPERQGGYCMNATVEIAGTLLRADRTGDLGRGPLPPADRLLAEVKQVDVSRLQVDTPPEVADDVALVARDGDPAAFARIAQDYLERCRTAAPASP